MADTVLGGGDIAKNSIPCELTFLGDGKWEEEARHKVSGDTPENSYLSLEKTVGSLSNYSNL